MLRRSSVPNAPDSKKVSATPGEVEKNASLDKDLHVIYGGEDETDFSKLDVRRRKRGPRLLLWTLATLVILAGAAWGGYMVFQKTFNQTGEPLTLTIEGPEEVKSGEAVQFDVIYQNRGHVPLANLELKLNLPKGFSPTTMEPAPTTAPDVWTIGSVTAGSDGLIRLKGTWIDPVPSGQTVQAIATYHPANFNSDFQAIATKAIVIKESTLLLTVEGPATATSGSTIDYTYTIKNDGPSEASNLHLRLTLPATFIVSSSDPAPIEGGAAEWALAAPLPAGTEAKITVTGAYAADATGVQTIHGSVGVMREESYVEQTVLDSQTDVLGGGLSLRLIVNGSTEEQTADLGSKMRLSIDVTNGGKEIVGGLSSALTVEGGEAIDWNKADLAGGSRSGNTVTWAGSVLSKKGILEGTGRETIDLSLPLMSSVSAEADTLTLTVAASITKTGDLADEKTLQSTPLVIQLNSDTSLSTSARYYEDSAAVGSGPLPPEVGQTTTLRVYWALDNTLHALDDVTVSATLPPSVAYNGPVTTDIGTVSLEPSTRTLTWTIDRLPTSVTHAGMTFDLSITPTADDVGEFVKLSNETTLGATDSVTGARLQLSGDILTTELPDDEEAAGKGAVIE
ncbi:MAG: hypothetical protein AAB865_02220 [Patescibacteria group bacterium]